MAVILLDLVLYTHILLGPELERKEKAPFQHVMFALQCTPTPASSSNSFYCDPQAVKKLMGREDLRQLPPPTRSSRGTDRSASKRVDSPMRSSSIAPPSRAVLRFVEPPKQTKKKKTKGGARAVCSRILRKLKPGS